MHRRTATKEPEVLVQDPFFRLDNRGGAKQSSYHQCNHMRRDVEKTTIDKIRERYHGTRSTTRKTLLLNP
jgi:hypothetical protein